MNLSNVGTVGRGLNRPECVLAHQSGWLFCSDSHGMGGIAAIAPSGATHRIAARGLDHPLHPNGIALEPGGSFLIAHLGTTDGGVFRIRADGQAEPFLVELDNKPLPPTNFVHRDALGRIWICVSTRLHPRTLAYRKAADDGYVILVDAQGARIVADGLGYTNECVVDCDSGLFFVNETFGRRTSRFSIAADGQLVDRTVVAEFGAGTFPDGLSLDAEGGLWVTSVVSNRLIRVTPDGQQAVMIENGDAAYMARVEASFVANRMDLDDITSMPASTLKNISSLAFAGADLRTGYLGSLGNDRLIKLDMPVAGRPQSHWQLELGSLIGSLY